MACIINILRSQLTLLALSACDVKNYSITYNCNWQHKLRLRHRLRLRWSTFIVQASFTIVTYDHQNIFIVQAAAAIFFCQVAAWVQGIESFILWKITKLLITQRELKPEKKISTNLECLELKKINECLTKLKNNQVFLHKIFESYLATTMLFIGWNISIMQCPFQR